ncbi:MAG: ABC transporter permease [Elusimicrobiota bacterium]|jgi:predicted ABC-type exoprotein transport system permease subunit|nr:ABC transporter permease [Elusimicrobiota bacterium]
MNKMWKKRKRKYIQQNLIYCQHVFNGSFICFIFLFFLVFYKNVTTIYRQFLNLPLCESKLIIVFYFFLLIMPSCPLIFVKEADSLFLLTKEKFVIKEIIHSLFFTLLLNLIKYIFGISLLVPFYLIKINVGYTYAF